MAKQGEYSLRIKLLVDNHSKRVLFAEAGKDFVDFLFNILMLPVATVIRLLNNKGMLGGLGNLYRSIQNISDAYMDTTAKEDLLKPYSPSWGTGLALLLPDSLPSARRTFYKCTTSEFGVHFFCCPNVADHPNVSCPRCQRVMTQQVVFLNTDPMNSGTSRSSGYVKEVVTYMVMDNLEVKPMSTISSITELNCFGVKDIGALEEKVIDVGMKEALELLKTSLCSNKVLTDVFFVKV